MKTINIEKTEMITTPVNEQRKLFAPDGLFNVLGIEPVVFTYDYAQITSKFGYVSIEIKSSDKILVNTVQNFECKTIAEEIEFEMIQLATQRFIDEIIEATK